MRWRALRWPILALVVPFVASTFGFASMHLENGGWGSFHGWGLYVGLSAPGSSMHVTTRLSSPWIGVLPTFWRKDPYWSLFVPLWPVPLAGAGWSLWPLTKRATTDAACC